MNRTVADGLLSGKLLVCLGAGGVGKTTVSAALALGAAIEGRRVDVMTVDPAPRLLDALGLAPDDAAELCEVPLQHGSGRLRAMRLDPKRTFDAIVASHAPSPAAADAIMQNRIYRNLSQALAGVGDYMAMERLLELSESPDTDLVVLDTPPAREALDFLDAPRRLMDLLNSRAVTLLGGGMRRGFGVMDLAARAVLSAFDRLTGLHLLTDVQDFVRSFEGMYAGFADRAARVQRLLGADSAAIIVVTTAEPERIAHALEFVSALHSAGIKPRAVIVNRTLPAVTSAGWIAQAPVRSLTRRKLKRAAAEFSALRERERIAVESLRTEAAARFELFTIPDFGAEPSELGDLARLKKSLAIL
jgi:anion-transporting  ArsA/GET3 family ATPase